MMFLFCDVSLPGSMMRCRATRRLNTMVMTKIFSALICLGLLTGCDAVLDCLDNDGPVFNKVELRPAVLNQVYSDSIIASVRNEPQDQRFDYQFSLSGQLPAGIVADPVAQNLVFRGTPTVAGEFPFKLYVEVDDGLDAQQSGLCFVSRTSDFVLRVSEIQDSL